MKFSSSNKKSSPKIQKGFTLFELLITVSIVAIVMTITVVTLNPAEYLRKARDVKRISDLTNLQIALQLISTDKTISMGVCDGTKIYASVPLETPLSNDNLPAGVSWVQVSQSNLMKNDGTGWIPIDFKSFASKGIQLPALPIDPKNSASDYLFYTYTCNSNRQFVLTAWFESTAFGLKGQDPKTKNDGGVDPYLYEVGTNLSLFPLKPIVYWSFDEGSGNIVYDRSGNENHGTLYGNIAWTTGLNGGALDFDGNDDYVRATQTINYFTTNAQTIEGWFKLNLNDNVYGVTYQAENYDGNTGEDYYDTDRWTRRAVVGTHGAGYLCTDINVPSGRIGPFALTVYSRAGTLSSSVAWRVEVYENDILKWTYERSNLSTTYTWYESPTWFFDDTKTYKIKVYWPGNVDIYFDLLSIMARRGGFGQGGVAYRFMLIDNKSIGYYTKKSDGTYNYSWFSSQHFIPNDEKFHHVAVTLKNGTKTLYIDGEKKQSYDNCGDLYNAVADIYLGSIWRTFYGIIDEFRIFNRALNDAEIKNIYNMGRN